MNRLDMGHFDFVESPAGNRPRIRQLLATPVTYAAIGDNK